MTIGSTILQLIESQYKDGRELGWSRKELVNILGQYDAGSIYAAVTKLQENGNLVVTNPDTGKRNSQKNPLRYSTPNIIKKVALNKDQVLSEKSKAVSDASILFSNGTPTISVIPEGKTPLKNAQIIADKKAKSAETSEQPEAPSVGIPPQRKSAPAMVTVSDNYRKGYRDGSEDIMKMIRDGVIPIESLVLQLARNGTISAETLTQHFISEGLIFPGLEEK